MRSRGERSMEEPDSMVDDPPRKGVEIGTTTVMAREIKDQALVYEW